MQYLFSPLHSPYHNAKFGANFKLTAVFHTACGVSITSGLQSNHHTWFVTRKVRNVEELETLPAGTKPRTSHYQSLEERGMERGSARQSSLKGRERAIVRPTNIGNHFKGNVREASERRGGAHTGFSEHTDTILN